MTILHSVRILLCSALAVATTAGFSQGVSAKTEPGGDVEIVATMSNPSACVGADYLSVRIMVVNKGADAVDLDVSRLSTTAGFVALINTTEMQFRAQSLGSSADPIGKAKQTTIIQLPPRGFYDQEVRFSIHDVFFNQAGFYNLNLASSIRVGQDKQAHDVFSSNSLIFELRPCSSK
ncbi:MAG TPA: hypothetical protein VGG42_11430 [Acidobacteriaceae bacterium]|jgi:hypothetical protein